MKTTRWKIMKCFPFKCLNVTKLNSKRETHQRRAETVKKKQRKSNKCETWEMNMECWQPSSWEEGLHHSHLTEVLKTRDEEKLLPIVFVMISISITSKCLQRVIPFGLLSDLCIHSSPMNWQMKRWHTKT